MSGDAAEHRCSFPDPDYYEPVGRGTVIECGCGARWQVEYIGSLLVRWVRLTDG